MRSSPPLRRLLAFGLLALAVTALTGPPLRVLATTPAHVQREAQAQTGTNRAGLVIRYADGDVETACVSFAADDIAGDEVLRLAEVELGLATDGRVCTLNRVGCLPNDCWCECSDLGNCTYWAYYHLNGSAWTYSDQGATSYRVGNGAVEGWSWGKGTFGTTGVEPPVFTFDQICSQAAATATLTPSPTPTVRSQQPVTSPPQISVFAAVPQTIATGGCTTLQWTVVNAEEVQLEGATVGAQGQQQACPPASQSYSLVAMNAAGSDVREVEVEVRATSAAPSPTFSTAAQPTVWPTLRPTVLAPRGPASPSQQPTAPAFPTPVSFATPALVQPLAAPGQGAGPAVPESPGQAAAVEVATVVVTRPPFRFAPPSTSTPRPRAVLGADGRPTPTPMLVARVDAEAKPRLPEQKLQRARGEAGLATANRSFQASLLPGYAAFLFMAASLLGISAWVTRRRLRAGRPGADR